MERSAKSENPYDVVVSEVCDNELRRHGGPLEFRQFVQHAFVFGVVFGAFSFLITYWQPVWLPVSFPARNVVYFRPNVPEWAVIIRWSEDWWLSCMIVAIGLHQAVRTGRRTEMLLMWLLGYAFLGVALTAAARVLVLMHPFVTQSIATELRFLTFIPTTWVLTATFIAGCGFGSAGGRSFVMSVACFVPVLVLHFTIRWAAAQFVDLTEVRGTDQKTYVILTATMNGLETCSVFVGHLSAIGLVYCRMVSKSSVDHPVSR